MYLYTRIALRPQTYFRSSLTRVPNQFRNKKSKYPEEYTTVDKVGSEKPLASKSYFIENESHPHFSIICKQARLNAGVRAFLLIEFCPRIAYYIKRRNSNLQIELPILHFQLFLDRFPRLVQLPQREKPSTFKFRCFILYILLFLSLFKPKPSHNYRKYFPYT